MEVVKLHPDAAQGKPDFVMTPTAEAITGALDYYQSKGKMGLIVGDSGMGKTVAAKRFVREEPRTRFHLEVTTAINTMQAVLQILIEVLGHYPERGGGPMAYHRHLLQLLAPVSYRRPMLLVIDEAQHLEANAAEALRGLHDATGASIVFVANRDLQDRWRGTRAGRQAWQQMNGRISFPLDLNAEADGPGADDIAAIAEGWGIKGRTVRGLLMRAARGAGGLRNVNELLDLAGDYAAGGAITAAHIEQAMAIRGQRS